MAMSPDITADSLAYYLTDAAVITRPTAWEVSLHSGSPGANGADNEITDSGYSRAAVNFALDVSNPVLPFVSNDALIMFGEAVAEYTVTHIVVWAGSTPLVIQALRIPRTIPVEEQAQFAIGELIVGGNI